MAEERREKKRRSGGRKEKIRRDGVERESSQTSGRDSRESKENFGECVVVGNTISLNHIKPNSREKRTFFDCISQLFWELEPGKESLQESRD